MGVAEIWEDGEQIVAKFSVHNVQMYYTFSIEKLKNGGSLFAMVNAQSKRALENNTRFLTKAALKEKTDKLKPELRSFVESYLKEVS